jgi:ferredoxin
MAGRLETLVSGHQAMMADVSHQLRTPLAALRLRLDVLAIQAPDHLVEELAGAHDEIGRLSRMVDGLLAVARAENVTAAPVPVHVAAVISDRCAAWKPAADEKPVDLSAPATEPLTARMREGHLEQILDNLLANAIEAVPSGGSIRITARHAGDRIRIVVADDGPGMSEQQRRAAFRRFASARPGGTGLGLAIVHRLITADGGTAELSDTPGGGLTVILDVPAIPRDRTTRRQAVTSGRQSELATTSVISIFSSSEGLLNWIPMIGWAGCVCGSDQGGLNNALAARQCHHAIYGGMAVTDRVTVNPIACPGHGICAEMLPELIGLDEWGYPMVADREVPHELSGLARRAARLCPTLALRLERGKPARQPTGTPYGQAQASIGPEAAGSGPWNSQRIHLG